MEFLHCITISMSTSSVQKLSSACAQAHFIVGSLALLDLCTMWTCLHHVQNGAKFNISLIDTSLKNVMQARIDKWVNKIKQTMLQSNKQLNIISTICFSFVSKFVFTITLTIQRGHNYKSFECLTKKEKNGLRLLFPYEYRKCTHLTKSVPELIIKFVV